MKIKIKNTVFEVEKSKYDLFWEDIGSGKWEPETFNVIDFFTEKNSTVIDMGCWGGPISLYAANIAVKVYAIDPDPEIFIHLQNNIKLNPVLSEKIKCFNVAIANKNEDLVLYARKNYGLSSSSTLPRIRDELSSHTSKGMSLETLIENEKIENVSLIKMDIEGGEFALLENMEKNIQRLNFPTLYISFHYNYLREHQHYLYIKQKFLSKIIMKIEGLLSIDLFRKTNKEVILNTFRPFNNYKYIYTETGKLLDMEQLRNNPFLIKKHNLVVTNKEWK